MEIDQNGVKWLSKSVRDGPWTQNMHLGELRGTKVKAQRRPDGHLGNPRDGLDAILGPLGRPGRRFWVNFGGIWGSQTGPERRFFGSGVEKCKIAKSFVFPCVFHGF